MEEAAAGAGRYAAAAAARILGLGRLGVVSGNERGSRRPQATARRVRLWVSLGAISIAIAAALGVFAWKAVGRFSSGVQSLGKKKLSG